MAHRYFELLEQAALSSEVLAIVPAEGFSTGC
jgi:hypothetical protein